MAVVALAAWRTGTARSFIANRTSPTLLGGAVAHKLPPPNT
jgi:hypothetical protein